MLQLGEPEKVRDDPEVILWVRWLLVGLAVTLLVAAKLLGRAIWIDVAAVTIVALLVYAVVQARSESKRELEAIPTAVIHPHVGRARFELSAAKLADPLSEFKKNETAILLIVTSQPSADGKTTTKKTQRFVVTLGSTLAAKSNEDPVRITLNRGASDMQAAALMKALAQMERYYVLPHVAGSGAS